MSDLSIQQIEYLEPVFAMCIDVGRKITDRLPQELAHDLCKELIKKKRLQIMKIISNNN